MSFPHQDLAEQLAAFAARWPDARACARGRSFAAEDAAARLWLPFASRAAAPGEAVADYLARADDRLGVQVVLLLRAGAMAIGCWEDDELVVHKAQRKYVVRGHGRAQATHRKTRGKSRYGSRLRLQNWKRLLEETNERLRGIWRDFGPPRAVFLSVPVRVLADLVAATPAPPFAVDDPGVVRIPLHVHRPDHAELLRVRRWLVHGRLEVPHAE
ncbi:MAG: hypothetical protein JNK78_07100 [Planctomycetes bacterium]|nr:hypothetical protein [Planctomycetota bacterium]